MNATERFKALFANAIERICILEEQLELAQDKIAKLENEQIKNEDQTVDA